MKERDSRRVNLHPLVIKFNLPDDDDGDDRDDRTGCCNRMVMMSCEMVAGPVMGRRG